MPVFEMQDGQLVYEDGNVVNFPYYRNNILFNSYREFLNSNPIEVEEWIDVTNPSFWDVNAKAAWMNDGLLWTGVDWILRPDNGNGVGNYLYVRDNWTEKGWIYGIRLTYVGTNLQHLYVIHEDDEIINGFVSSGAHLPIYVSTWQAGNYITGLSFTSTTLDFHLTKIEVRLIPYYKNIEVIETSIFENNISSMSDLTKRYSTDDFIQICYAGTGTNMYHSFWNGSTFVTDTFTDIMNGYLWPLKFGNYPAFTGIDTDDKLLFKYKNGENWITEEVYQYAGNGTVWFSQVDSIGIVHLIYQSDSGTLKHHMRSVGGVWTREDTAVLGTILNTGWVYLDDSDKIHIAFMEFSGSMRTAYLTNATESWVKEVAETGIDICYFFKGRSDYPTILGWRLATGKLYRVERSSGSWQSAEEFLPASSILAKAVYFDGDYYILSLFDDQVEEYIVNASTLSFVSKNMLQTNHGSSSNPIFDYLITTTSIVAAHLRVLTAESGFDINLLTYMRDL